MALPVTDLIQRCDASRAARRQRYGALRTWFLRGTIDVGAPARYNKLKSHLKKVTSYLYAPEGTRFALTVPPEYRQDYLPHVDIARDAWLSTWRDSGADVQFASQVTWSLAYGATMAKILPQGPHGVRNDYVFPGDFGVLREDVPSLDDQEIFAHWYHLTVPQVADLVAGRPDAKKITDWAKQNASPERISGQTGLPTFLQDVLVPNVNRDFFGSGSRGAAPISSASDDMPQNLEPLVECCELWEVRDFKTPSGHRFRDYWVTTVIGEWPVIERRNPVLPYMDNPLGPAWPSENPFVKVCPDPLLDYFWGLSALADLLALQEWRETRMRQIDKIFALQLEPPIFFSGVSLPDEKLKAMRSIGGYVSTPQQGAKMDVLKPDMPTDAFQVIREIDSSFGDAGGVPPILEAQQDGGLRAGNQVGAMANIAVGRLREQALVVEDACEVLATRMFHLQQRRDETAYPLGDGKHFLLSELPIGVTVKVSAHSASPVYAEQTLAKAQLLRREKAIDLPTFVDLTDPPHREDLVEKAKRLEKSQQEMAQKVFELQQIKAERGRQK